MKNTRLKRDVKKLLNEVHNIVNITKGIISGFSIEVEYKEPVSVSSYVYYENKNDRDIDYKELEKLIK